MRAVVEVAGFACVSLLAHLAVFAATAPEGADSGGSVGAQEVTVAAPLGAAGSELAALVQKWERPVELPAFEAPEAMAPPPDRAADLPPDAPPSRPDSPTPRALPDLPGMDAVAQIVNDVPALFDRPETRDTPRPRARPEPKPAASASSAPRAARASGQANQAQAGSGRADLRSGASVDTNALVQWGGGIRAAVQRRQGNPGTRAQGTVHLRLQINSAGGLVSVGVAQSSGNATLDRAAIRAVQGARFPRAPNGVSGTHSFNLPLSYR